MIREIQLRVYPSQAANESSIMQVVAQELGIPAKAIKAVRVLKKSVDARQRTVKINLKVRAYINELPTDDEYIHRAFGNVSEATPITIVGAGPAGLFAALRLIELGYKPIVIERGKNVRDRRKDIALISREHRVDPESNYSFGEGGAGAYSDGKLYTRSKKRGSVERILHTLCQHGASTAILADAHPHIGTDKLPTVIENMRKQILQSGGEVHFETKMQQLHIVSGKLQGILTSDGKEFPAPVILATGHSARDVYYGLHEEGITLESKGIAVGVRLEHPQQLIDQIQYHNKTGRGEHLPAAEYSFVSQTDGRGVYSFCMCPGGFVVPAASDVNQIVVNGMSPSNRGSKWANSGMVVEVRPEDLPAHHQEQGVLGMIKFQEEMEYQCFLNGNRKQTAPAQRMADFVNGRNSASLPSSSYTPGLIASPLHFWMPEFVTSRLKGAFNYFGRVSRGFLTNEATLIGVETRTSSPVRIPRHDETLQHITLAGLYPCGEGAGYAGGIVSAAIDGERCAEAVALCLE